MVDDPVDASDQQIWQNCRVWHEIATAEAEFQCLEVLGGVKMSSLGGDEKRSEVPGRLRGRREAYVKLCAEEYVLLTVEKGYKLVWKDGPPPPACTRNNKSARERPEFVQEEVKRLEDIGCLKRVFRRPTVVLPLSVVFSNKWRLLVDASRHLNPWCERRGVRLDGLEQIVNTVKPLDFMVVNDLESGYWFENFQ